MKRVTVELPPRLWWVLATAAEEAGVTVADVIVSRLSGRDQEGPAPELAADLYVEHRAEHRIVMLVRDGFDDGAISRATGLTRQYVGHVRRRAGMRPNRVAPWSGPDVLEVCS